MSKPKQTRLKPEARKEQMLTAALSLAEQSHYLTITRNEIARALGVSGPAVQYHFKTMKRLRAELVRAAVEREVLAVVAQAILLGSEHVQAAPEALKLEAMAGYV